MADELPTTTTRLRQATIEYIYEGMDSRFQIFPSDGILVQPEKYSNVLDKHQVVFC